jgi:hypothetical protein
LADDDEGLEGRADKSINIHWCLWAASLLVLRKPSSVENDIIRGVSDTVEILAIATRGCMAERILPPKVTTG